MLPPETINIPEKRDKISLSEQAVLKLLELDVEPTTAKRLVGKAMAAHMELRKVGDVVKVAYQSYLSLSAQDVTETENTEDGDLRDSNDYDDMKAAGTIETTEW